MIEIIPNWHPIFVHFTVALFSVATGLYVLSLLVPNDHLKEQWRIVARWNLWLGMAITLVTVLTGWYAYNTVAHDEPSHLAMTDHRNWALATTTLFLLVTIGSILLHRAGKEISTLILAMLLIAMAALGSTAWRGGELVYRYGLGVISLPNTGNHGHVIGETGDGHGKGGVVGVHHEKEDERPSETNEESYGEKQINTKVVPHDDIEGSVPHSH